jgi:hypothetical protein
MVGDQASLSHFIDGDVDTDRGSFDQPSERRMVAKRDCDRTVTQLRSQALPSTSSGFARPTASCRRCGHRQWRINAEHVARRTHPLWIPPLGEPSDEGLEGHVERILKPYAALPYRGP